MLLGTFIRSFFTYLPKAFVKGYNEAYKGRGDGNNKTYNYDPHL